MAKLCKEYRLHSFEFLNKPSYCFTTENRNIPAKHQNSLKFKRTVPQMAVYMFCFLRLFLDVINEYSKDYH